MAITIVNTPTFPHTAYNPVVYEIDSNNKNLPGFRYIVQIFTTSTTPLLLAELQVAPDPTINGRAKVDISKIIQTQVDKFIDFNINNAQDSTNGTTFTYQVKFGESYNFSWAFDNYVFQPGSLVALTTESSIDPTFSNVPHGLSTGNIIKVELDQVWNSSVDLLNGTYEVVAVPNPQRLVLGNLDFGTIGSNPATPGVVTLLGVQKIRVLDLNSHTNTCINASQNAIEWNLYEGALIAWSASQGSHLLLIDTPDGFRVTPNQWLYLNVFGIVGLTNVFFVNDTGDTFAAPLGGITAMRTLGIGPGNLPALITLSGIGPLIKPQTKYYEVTVQGANDSITQRYYVDRRCTINETQILFMDRKGSFSSFSFPLQQFRKQNGEKENYRRYISTNDTYDRGDMTFYSQEAISHTLTTNFLTTSENLYFEQLLTSRHTFIQLDDIWYGCTIKGGGYDTLTERNKKLVKRTITIELSVNQPIN